jgi:alpha-glucuronidase
MENKMDIILLQQHWLYHYELNLLNEMHYDFRGVGKSVDSEHQSIGKNYGRDHGGVAILWSSALDPYIKPVQYGGVSIQCVEMVCRVFPFMKTTVLRCTQKYQHERQTHFIL